MMCSRNELQDQELIGANKKILMNLKQKTLKLNNLFATVGLQSTQIRDSLDFKLCFVSYSCMIEGSTA